MIVIYIVLGLLVVFFVLSMMGPRDYTVARSTSIARSRSDVYNYLRFLKNQEEWGPWAKLDPNMEHNYIGTDGEVGFVSQWKGNKQVGEGQQEITELVENETIGSHLSFIKPFKAESDVELRLKERANGETMVTWHMHGKNSTAISRIFGLFMNMDKALGKDFDEGLGTLKGILEKSGQ